MTSEQFCKIPRSKLIDWIIKSKYIIIDNRYTFFFYSLKGINCESLKWQYDGYVIQHIEKTPTNIMWIMRNYKDYLLDGHKIRLT